MTATRTWPAVDRTTGLLFQQRRNVNVTLVVAFLAAHVVLGLVASELRIVATAHGVITVLVGLAIAFTSPRIDRILAVAGYAAMCDVFWRMTRSQMPWESAKYTAALLLLIAFFRFVKRPSRIGVPIAYFALLLPACAITIVVLPSGEARSQIAANLAGPLLLTASVVVFRQVIAHEAEVARLLWLLLGPIVAVGAIATRSTSSAGSDAFGETSSFAAAGGFGPNQVSMLLGLGALVCVALALHRVTAPTLLLELAIGGWLTAQASLTLSRGGLYGAAAGVAAIIVAALATSGMRSRVAMGLAVGVVISVVAFPYLNSFTNGSLENRFADTSTSNRNEIAAADLELFEREPMFGVGVGVAKYERATTETAFEVETKAHTEFTRMLGEHGAFGVVSLVLLISMAVAAVRRAASRWNRLIAAAFSVWALISMSHSATSIAAICFMFGFAHLRAHRDRVASATSGTR